MNKNITLNADENLIKKARLRAQQERRSLNAAFREWLTRYAVKDRPDKKYESLMKKLSYVQPGKTFSRDELNER